LLLWRSKHGPTLRSPGREQTLPKSAAEQKAEKKITVKGA
jgi:hypothetical protein